MKTYGIFSSLIIKIGIVILVLGIASMFTMRLDLSRQKAFSLSKVSKDAVRSLDDKMLVKIIASPELPSELSTLNRYVRDLLNEYQIASRGKFRFEYVKHNTKEELDATAMKNGLSVMQFQIYEKDQMTSKEVIFGAIFEYQGKVQSLNLVPRLEPKLEYELTMKIQALADDILPKIAVFRDTTYYDFDTRYFERALTSNYQIVDTNLDNPITDVKALLFTGSARNLPEEKLYNLDQYLMKGGKVVWLQDKIDTDGKHLYSLDTNVIQMLLHYGVKLSDDVVLDATCDKRQVGVGNFASFPMYPILRGSEHPITQNMANIVMYLASGLSFSGTKGITFEPILQSSLYSAWLKAPEFQMDQDMFYNPSLTPYTAGAITTAALVKGEFNSFFVGSELSKNDPEFMPKSNPNQYVIFADKEMVIDSDRPIFNDRSNVVFNAIDYLIGRESMITIRSRHLSTSLLSVPLFMEKMGIIWGDMQKIENNIRLGVKIIAIALPAIILILTGLIMAFKRKMKLRQTR